VTFIKVRTATAVGGIVIVPMYKKGDKTACSNYTGIYCYNVHTKLYAIFFSQD
jgi:hypothetical protein